MSKASKILRRLRTRLLQRPRKSRPREYLGLLERWIVLILIFAAIVVITAPPFYFKYIPPEPVKRTIKMPFSINVEDQAATEQLRKMAEESYIRYYEYNGEVRNDVLRAVDRIIGQLVEASAEGRKSKGERIKNSQAFLEKEVGLNLGEKHSATLLELANSQQTRVNLYSIFDELFSRRGVIADKYAYQSYEQKNVAKLIEKNTPATPPISSATMLGYPEEVRVYLREKLIPRFYPDAVQQEAIFALCSALIQPNIYLLEGETLKARTAALQKVKPVMRSYQKGDIVIRSGEKLTRDIQRVIDAINEQARRYFLLRLLGDTAFVLVIFTFIVLYVRKISPDFAFTGAGIILLSLPVVIALVIGRLLLTYLGEEEISGFLFPAGIIGMLGIILINPRIAFALVVWGVLLFGLIVEFNFRYMIVAFFGGLTALLSLYTVRERKDVLMAGFKTALVNFAIISVISLIDEPARLPFKYAGLGIINGILCAFITLPSLPLFEYFFGVVTDVRLLELTGITQPLLRELEEKAPGTYQHSLSVAKLSEPAAQAIASSYLLVRAGAYYHDIGKMLKPKYYTENQLTPEEKRIHNNLTPNMSMLIVRTHVKEGMELAKRYGLPQKIIDFIPQHHGTSLIRYFYQRALQQYNESESNIPVREEDFRYLGPKPQTVEAAIVMLADAVEATVTSRLTWAHVSEEEIRRVVHETIVEKFNDGQLSECPLTLRDLHNISESFVNTLIGRFHFRVDYPPTLRQRELSKASESPELTHVSYEL